MPTPSADRLVLASRIVLSLLLLTLVSGLLVPVYTDEVAWRFQLSRWLIDGLDRSVGETCGANTAAAPAWFMLPVRLFSSWSSIAFADPLFVRLAGVGGAMLGVTGLMLLIRRVAHDAGQVAVIRTISCALLGLGVLPYLLVWSRPELPLWLAMLGAALLALGWRERAAGREPWGRIAGIVVLAAVAMSYHAKGVVYLPVFALAIWMAGAGRATMRIRIVASLMLVVIGHAGTGYWSGKFACPDDPLMAARIGQESLAATLAAGGVPEVMGRIPQMIGQALPTAYVAAIMPAGDYMSAWLPGAAMNDAALKTWRGLTDIGWYAALALTLVWIGLALFIGVPRRWPPLSMALVLAGCATGWAALQINKNAYEAALYLPVMVLALGLALSAFDRLGRGPVLTALALALVSGVSQAILITHYVPRLTAAVAPGGYVAGQPFSISPYRYPRAAIVAAGRQCGLVPQRRDRRVLIDDLTYFAYIRGEAPMHRLGVLSGWNGSLGDPIAWARRQGSPGGVLACAHLPAAMRARAVASGAVCCFRTEWFDGKARDGAVSRAR